MDKGTEWEDSLCTDTYLHRYNPILTDPECVVDVCEICGDEQYHQVLPDGSSDNNKFLSYNLRLALTRDNPLSVHEYAEI